MANPLVETKLFIPRVRGGAVDLQTAALVVEGRRAVPAVPSRWEDVRVLLQPLRAVGNLGAAVQLLLDLLQIHALETSEAHRGNSIL